MNQDLVNEAKNHTYTTWFRFYAMKLLQCILNYEKFKIKGMLVTREYYKYLNKSPGSEIHPLRDELKWAIGGRNPKPWRMGSKELWLSFPCEPLPPPPQY